MAFMCWDTTASGTKNAPLTSNQSIIVDVRLADLSQNITGTVTSDQSGTLYIEQSGNNGVNYDASDSVSVTGGTSVTFSQAVVLPTWRLRYVNGGSNQSFLRLFAKSEITGTN
jgi:hypothetical protein